MLEGRILAFGFKYLGIISDCPKCRKPTRWIEYGPFAIRVDELGRTSADGGEILVAVHEGDRCNPVPGAADAEFSAGIY